MNDGRMNEHASLSTGQVTGSAAEIYESFFVPALFGQWPERVLDAAELQAGDALIDVGCGTGIVARAAAERLAGTGSVTGVDINEGMLAVARSASDSIDWRSAPAEALPFDDGTFDRAVSQFVLMFLPDPTAAVAEMRRVVRPGGSVTVATWSDITESPGYDAMVKLLDRLFGTTVAEALLAPFTLGSESKVIAVAQDVLPDIAVVRHQGEAHFVSLDAWMHTDVRGWTLADMIDDEQFTELLAAARSDLAEFVQPDGSVRFAAPALIASAVV